MPKTKNTYQEGTKLKSMCRVCLTRSNNIMFNLTDKLTADDYDADTYLEALEKVTSERVQIDGRYPESICPMCVSILKMALQLVSQFQTSQRRLERMFKNDSPTYESINIKVGSSDEESYMNTEEILYDSNDSSNVQLIIKNEQFNLNDILVVEGPDEQSNDYNGFLSNLGKEISASVVTSKSKNLTEIPIDTDFSVIKIEPDNNFIENTENKLEIINEPSDVQEYIEFNITKEEYEEEEDVQEDVDETDQKLYSGNEYCSNEADQQIEDQENENEDNSNISSDPQNTPDHVNLEYIEIDMFDKDTIESLIIDRSKSNEYVADVSQKPARRRRGKKEEEIKDEFLKEVKFPCGICKNVYQSVHSLRTHVRRTHLKRYDKSFTCEICGVFCRSRSAFVNHKLKHGDKQFKCDLCDKSYTTKVHLKVHKLAHANTRPYLCNVCGKDFNYANALTYHMRLHTGEKNYHCEYCPKRFRMINTLNRHLRTHTGEKPYKCQYCGRNFSSRGEVVCHEYIHTGYRPYHCIYCKKGFSKTHNLKIHLLSHGGPYHCQFCNKTFIEEKILGMHYKISHKDLVTEEMMQEGSEEDSPDSQDNAEIIELEESLDADGVE